MSFISVARGQTRSNVGGRHLRGRQRGRRPGRRRCALSEHVYLKRSISVQNQSPSR